LAAIIVRFLLPYHPSKRASIVILGTESWYGYVCEMCRVCQKNKPFSKLLKAAQQGHSVQTEVYEDYTAL